MNDVLQRLKSLYKTVGIPADENNKSSLAEITAYDFVLSKLYDKLADDNDELFLIGCDAFNKRQCTLTGIDARDYDDEELIEKIMYVHSRPFCEFDDEQLETDLKRLGLEEAFSAHMLEVTVDYQIIRRDNIPLKNIGWFFARYLPPFVESTAGSFGMTFDEWDAADYHFADIDNIGLNFYFLASL